ncbi:uncharacterized protein LOC115537680 [Gadus morhua]|uniref:uncharacterized protein LOC115537680 n=1 Tax=Gadus morhua TaxID=8049 RepID=UPI0011B37E15|nr:uncharacterized protein LOC115537680 [Gadus morhua]
MLSEMRFTRCITMIQLEMLLNVIFVSGGVGSCPTVFHASMPNKMEALRDTCLQIPCSFDSLPSNKIDKSQPILGAWIKSNPYFGHDPENLVFHSNIQDNIYPISISGNMSEHNCTTVFTNMISSYADVYYFRVESTSFFGTDICSPLTITVKDSAPAPSIQTLQEGPLTEGSRVTFTCRAIAPCPTQPPHLSWNQSGGPEGRPEPHRDQEPNVRTRRLDITLSDRHDGVRLTCLAEYPVNDPAGGPSNRTAESVVTLNVSYSPKDTQASVSPSTVSLGSVVNLTCTSRANPPVLRFTWFRSSAEGPLNVSDGSLYSFNVSSCRGIYYCVATNPLGNQTSKEIKLTISGESVGLNVPLIVRFLIGIVFFIGLVISVLWSLKKPSTRQQNPICKASDKKVEEFSFYNKLCLLAVKNHLRLSEMRFTRCITMIQLEMLLNVIFVSGGVGSCPEVFHASMPNKMEALRDTCLQIPCSFDSLPSHRIDKSQPILGAWIKSNPYFRYRPENVVFHSNIQDNIYPISIIGNMSEHNCTTVFTNMISSYADVYYFRVESTGFCATDICSPLTITVKDSAPAPSIQTLLEGPLTEGSRVTFTCRAIAPCPTQPPHLSWNQSGGPEGRPEPHGDQEPNVRTRWLDITLSDRHDGVRLTCLAEYPVNDPAGGPSNRTAESVVTLNVSYSPKDTQASVSPPTVSLGSVVNLTCTSRANPPVLRFTWFRSSAEGPLNVSDGSLYSFNVSSYRGIYYCVATNPLGNQTSKEITLTVSGESVELNVLLIIGGFFGTVFFIGLIIGVLWLQKKISTQQQNPIFEASDKQVEEEIHYGEIDFAKRGAVQNPVFPQGEEQTSEYVEITAQQAKNSQIRAKLERS